MAWVGDLMKEQGGANDSFALIQVPITYNLG